MSKKTDNNPLLRQAEPHRFRQIRADEFDGVQGERMSELSIPARLALFALRTCSDKNGVFPWHPKTLKLRVYPHDNLDFEALLNELLEHGDFFKFTYDGQEYGCHATWKLYQRLNTQEAGKPSVYPEPPQLNTVQDVPKTS
jgi:hypothetical protein